SHQLEEPADVERFLQRPDPEPVGDVAPFVGAGGENDGDLRQLAARLAQLLDHPTTVGVRHHVVDQHQRGGRGAGGGDGVARVWAGLDRVTVQLQQVLEDTAAVGVVFDDENGRLVLVLHARGD